MPDARRQTLSPPPATDYERRLLHAIAAIESGHNPRAIGRRGERGAYQFRAGAWRDTQRRLGWRTGFVAGAFRDDIARTVALSHLRWLDSSLASARVERTPASLYAAWNLGLEGFKRRGFNLSRCPARTREAAQRVSNLIH